MSAISRASLTGQGKMKVTRVCAVESCGMTIESPHRFCDYHWAGTPGELIDKFNIQETDQGRAPAVDAIVEHWQKADQEDRQ